MKLKIIASILGSLITTSSYLYAETITIATVNNGDMLRMKKLSSDFISKNPNIQLEWVTLDETDLRNKVTKDVITNKGEYDVMTIGTYEVPIWAHKNWLLPLTFTTEYDINDLIPAIKEGLSVDKKLYAAPFYGESSMIMYRKDLFKKAELSMPKNPSWNFIANAARSITDKKNGIAGICLRGKAGWGENMALLTATANSFGAKWFDMRWNPQFDSPEWKNTLNFYVNLMKKSGPQKAYLNGFSENLNLFNDGKCGMWIDATVAASFVTNPKNSKVADKVGFALAPNNGLGKNGNWLWSWSLAIPNSSKKADAAKKFIEWATSKEYSSLVASKEGWASVPPGTRVSLYNNQKYMDAAPFAKVTLESIYSVDPSNPTVDEVPYVGVQFVAISEFQSIATIVGQQFSAALKGDITVEEALKYAQSSTIRTMKKAQYIK